MQHVQHEWLVEIRILKGMYGAADIWVPFKGSAASIVPGQPRVPIRLVIMVDGEAHFLANHAAPDTSLEKQQRIDQDFNNRCWQLNLRLLRLHYSDTKFYSQLINTAIRRCLAAPGIRFQMFSVSIKQNGKQAAFGPRPVDMAGCRNHKRKTC